MTIRISPLWWPLLIAASPLLIPLLAIRNSRFRKNVRLAESLNSKRIDSASLFDIPELEYLDLTVIVEEKYEEGFKGDAGVSYLFRSDRGSLLYDVGFGPERPSFGHNTSRLGIRLDQIDSLCISHLHPDHMGGLKASRRKHVTLPDEFGKPSGMPCFLPDKADADGFTCEVVDAPGLLTGGIATTGPLARSLFFFGFTEEQALIARIKGKGLVVFTGCGHPTIEVIIAMVEKISTENIYVIGGGLHFPVTGGRGNMAGIQIQSLVGTGKPVWKRITDEDLDRTINSMNEFHPAKVFLSAHDSCDHSLEQMQTELNAEVEILKAGKTYRF